MSPSPIVPAVLRGSLAGWLAGGADNAHCHGFCGRLTREGGCDPVPNRPVSWDGLRLCRGFAARRNTIVVRRPRGRAATESAQ